MKAFSFAKVLGGNPYQCIDLVRKMFLAPKKIVLIAETV